MIKNTTNARHLIGAGTKNIPQIVNDHIVPLKKIHSSTTSLSNASKETNNSPELSIAPAADKERRFFLSLERLTTTRMIGEPACYKPWNWARSFEYVRCYTRGETVWRNIFQRTGETLSRNICQRSGETLWRNMCSSTAEMLQRSTCQRTGESETLYVGYVLHGRRQ